MRDEPHAFDTGRIAPALAAAWAVEAPRIDYLPVGFGSYHWSVTDVHDVGYFVTLDDLDTKPWLGTTRDETFAGLGTAYGAALALHRGCGLGSVVSPLPTTAGDPLLRVDDRFAMALFPFLDGRGGQFGDELGPSDASQLVQVLADVHRCPPPARLRVDAPVAGRRGLESALSALSRPWNGGPYSEPARQWLAEHGEAVRGDLDTLDRLVARTGERRLVVTHGEPHPGNLLTVGGRLRLVDWDTVALARPERDLWFVRDPAALQQYATVTGHVPDPLALSAYRLAWDLSDVASYVAQFRSPHERTEDTDASWTYLLETRRVDDEP